MSESHRVIAKAAERAAPVFAADQEFRWAPEPKGGTKYTPSAIDLALRFKDLLWSFESDQGTDDEGEPFRTTMSRGGRLAVYRTEDALVLAVEVGTIDTTGYPGMEEEF